MRCSNVCTHFKLTELQKGLCVLECKQNSGLTKVNRHLQLCLYGTNIFRITDFLQHKHFKFCSWYEKHPTYHWKIKTENNFWRLNCFRPERSFLYYVSYFFLQSCSFFPPSYFLYSTEQLQHLEYKHFRKALPAIIAKIQYCWGFPVFTFIPKESK